ncbi:hypothetical protein BZA05DRAFT_438218 [Tricharina praecox]|uniref:uncharacterized protein n=1 Tax=Tricharina praecox TaxID=43433 RepID=UPI00221EDD2A|nr:uncharacterized protein BZA05DRAFT_438218 [Tricharina praecox]KAI5846775.1 hypothetical protein BZA05DRAFT_438218 [Tricharina praecox]
MNNAQFRKLLETPRSERPASSNSTNGPPSATPALGSRMRSSIPMTPRSLTAGNNDFARQLAAHRAAQQPAKKFRSSAAPKGTQFGEGYTDRAKMLRESDEIEDERVQRLEALAQLAKDGHIDHEEYVRQTKLLGGDVSSTHLVKGLDFALLERVKRGENVMDKDTPTQEEAEEEEEDLEEKLDKVLGQEVATIERKKEKKQGQMAPPPKPKTRAAILAELKRSRQAAKEAAQPSLGDKFKKIGEPKGKERIEQTEGGAKVKLVVGADGKVKRKVKRSDKERKQKAELSPPPERRVMGMIPPPQKQQPEEEEDDDIFADAGDYDPLAGLGDEDEDTDTDDNTEASKRHKKEEATHEAPPSAPKENMAPPSTPKESIAPPPPSQPTINYFNESPAETDSDTYKPPTSASDLLNSNPELAAALAKASKLAAVPTKEESEREKRRKAFVDAHERDSYDIDMGFGGSRNFADDDEEDDVVDKKGGGVKRKRGGGKKKKGDKNSADVVGKIVEEKYGKGK